MAFSYALFIVLILIFPGLCFWAGWKYSTKEDFLKPSPDISNSTSTLLIVVFGTLLGHLFGAIIYMLQMLGCSWSEHCIAVSFDPNIYRVLVVGVSAIHDAPDTAFVVWILSILAIGVLTGIFANFISKLEWIASFLDPVVFGWLTPAIQAVRRGDSFVIAKVLTKTSDGGSIIAYEGTVKQLALDDDQSIKLIILNDVDGFLIRITNRGLREVRLGSVTIPQVQIVASEIANITFEILEYPDKVDCDK